MTSFAKIRFDTVGAENERTSAPDLFRHAFVDVGDISDQVLNTEKYIVYGPKGAGKTALAVRLESLVNQNLFVKTDDLEEFDFRLLQRFAKLSATTVGGPVAVWESLLALRLLSVLAADQAFIDSNTDLADLYSELRESLLPSRATLKTIAEDSVRPGRGIFEWLNAHFVDSPRQVPSDPASAWDALKRALSAARPIGDARHLLIVDGLDYKLKQLSPDSIRYADYIRYVDELLSAVKVVNAEFARLKAKVVVLIRSEILFDSTDSNIAKTIFDRGIQLWWYQKGEPAEGDLWKMVSKRAQMVGYEDSAQGLLKKWFRPPSVLDEILSCTRYLPRDVILFFHSLQRLKRNPPFGPTDFHYALQTYSPLFLVSLEDSVKGLIPDNVRSQLQHVLRRLGPRFWIKQLENSLRERHLLDPSSPNVETIARELFATGWIGNERERGREKKETFSSYSFQHPGMSVPFDFSGRCVVHRGLGPAIGR